MANTKSAQKRMRSAVKKTERNRSEKTRVRSAIKSVKTLAAEGKKDEATAALKNAASVLDKAAKHGVIHKNTASRQKSKLAQAANSAAA